MGEILLATVLNDGDCCSSGFFVSNSGTMDFVKSRARTGSLGFALSSRRPFVRPFSDCFRFVGGFELPDPDMGDLILRLSRSCLVRAVRVWASDTRACAGEVSVLVDEDVVVVFSVLLLLFLSPSAAASFSAGFSDSSFS